MTVIPILFKEVLEAFIFSQENPVSEKSMIELLIKNAVSSEDMTALSNELQLILEQLQQEYQNKGIRLYNIAGGWQFRTAEELAPYLVKVINKPKRLSRAAMETLAIIAYHQPCTRAEIENIRGVSLGQNVLDSLLESVLIKPCGTKAVPGRPILWGTTQDFLSYLGLNSLQDLPKKEDMFADIPYQTS
ncbi:SMC-Scp complex subunit ScpB [Commensalibacter communis]|uniref:SMC-Scp complex subunit ScpB n=1 Tax=Commensalibacter communis TaxID=2972786 RepID=UPI0022FF9CE5|nr:SMC-Scp complex subunit ScpB [Commensalibacter communis]CAI3952305.1 Chromosome segregation and condensation protein ScpB (ScpB) (PDB:1T6S) [Commensalibacter communis]CAI3954677.1 Chromosome segregation and condensation protein ScpB (ScpB) (PDB:1T6S) [Commensalibacter communis]